MFTKISVFIFLLFVSFVLVSPVRINGQDTQNASEKKVTFTSKVVDSKGIAIRDAIVTAGDQEQKVKTDANGSFTLTVVQGIYVVVNAMGYTPFSFVSSENNPSLITLTKAGDNSLTNEILYLPLNQVRTKREWVGQVSSVKGTLLEKYQDLPFGNSLQGNLTGLIVRSRTDGLGNNNPDYFVRGLAAGYGDNSPIILVDGIERWAHFVNPVEVENVEVIKDPVSKLMYGGRAANGIILITTKRGIPNAKKITVNLEYGYNFITRTPKYLNSFQYATLYNEARTNDGLTPFYSPAQLTGYQNSKGENDQLFPNVDYYNYFLKQSAAVKRASIDYRGGNENSKYALVIGYTGIDGFEKVGRSVNESRITTRGNLDFQISSNLKAFVDAAGIIDLRNWGNYDNGELFNALKTHRPNEYTFLVSDSVLKSQSNVLGLKYIPPLGGSVTRTNNLYGMALYGGETHHYYLYGQTNFGLDLNLRRLVKGLSVKTTFSFDNYQYFINGRSNTPPVYLPISSKNLSGADTILYRALNKRADQLNMLRYGNDITRTYTSISTLSYDKQIKASNLKVQLSQFFYKFEWDKLEQNVVNANTHLGINYSFRDKIYINASAAMMGSNKYAAGKRFEWSPAVGAAWILSEEPFLKNNSGISYLKVNASFGVLGYDRNTSYYLYQTRWRDNGTVAFNEVNAQSSSSRSSFDRYGNPNIGWEKSREINVGAEAAFLNNKLNVELNYFNTLRYDIVVFPSNSYTSFVGNYFPSVNNGKVLNNGFEGMFDWKIVDKTIGVNFGANFIYSKNKVLKYNLLNNPDPLLNAANYSSDVIYGYVANGLFKSQAEINSSAVQKIGNYGIGDIKYSDINGDGIVDQRDQSVIGNNFPRVSLGSHVKVSYKNWSLYMLGVAQLGVNVMRNNTYYRPGVEDKYSVQQMNRYHPVNNPGGTMPALHTLNNTNNYQPSTFWLQSSNFFRLRNAEITYQIKTTKTNIVNGLNLFLRGTNLLIAGKNKDLDPELINSGVDNYPVYRTVTMGTTIHF